mgnify:FL=1
MEIEITTKDLEEIERRYSDLAAWLANNFTSPVAALFVLQSVMDAINEARTTMSEEEED